MKKILTALIITALILTTITTLTTLTTTTKAQTTSDVQLLSYSWYVAPTTAAGGSAAAYPGDLVAVGAVQNIGSSPIGGITLVGIAYDLNNNLLAETSTNLYITYLPPQQIAPFYMDFPPSSSATDDQTWVPQVNNVTVAVGSVSAPTDGEYYSGLIISGSITNSTVSGVYTVSGNVEHRQPKQRSSLGFSGIHQRLRNRSRSRLNRLHKHFNGVGLNKSLQLNTV